MRARFHASGYSNIFEVWIDGVRVAAASFGHEHADEAAAFVALVSQQPIALDSETVEADIMRSGQAVIVDNPWQHPRVLQAKQEISRSEAYVQVPIFGHEKQVIGLLSADYYYSGRTVSPRDAAQLLALLWPDHERSAGQQVLRASALRGGLDVSTLAPGAYAIRVATDAGLRVGRFIKE